MNFKNLLATANIWSRHNDATVETTWTKKSWIENVRTIGCSDQDHAFVGFKAVHFNEKLIESLLTLIVTATQACATVTTDSIDFVDEDDTRRVFFTLFE